MEKSFVSGSSSSDTKTLLRYLVLAGELNFGCDIDKSVIERLKEPFPLIQGHVEFLLLGRRKQIWIARQRLAKSFYSYTSSLDYLMIDSEIVLFFEELDQPKIELD